MNPILPNNYFTPDVEAKVWKDGKLYLYGSNDISGNDAYCSYCYNVFSSDDMMNWNISENSFIQEKLMDEKGMLKPLFAPDCALINNRYCLFYCTKGDGEGVAFSDSPNGKFTNEQIIKCSNGDGIDPTVLVDGEDVYYFWGQFNLRGGKLNKELNDIVPETFTDNILTKEKHGFHEGSSIHKINGKYYMVFCDESRDGRPTCLSYAISDTPLGKYKKMGVIIDNINCDPSSWNNHGSLCEFKGKWYVFYHRSSHNGFFNRRVCVEPITINEDGTIKEVEMTTQGFQMPLSPKQVFNAERFCYLKGSVYIKQFDDGNICYDYLTNIHNNDAVALKYIDFSENESNTVTSVSIEISNVIHPCKVCIRLDSCNGEIISEFNISEKLKSFEFKKFKSTINKNTKGIHALFVTFHTKYLGKVMKLKNISFQ